MNLTDCHNVEDFRRLAKRRLPGPIFHYIDGAADDERTKDRNTASYDDCDLVPNVLAGVDSVDMRTTVMGREIAMPLFLSPTALQRLFHWQGERAVGAAAEKFGLPIHAVGVGETIEDLRPFDAAELAQAIAGAQAIAKAEA